MYNYIGLGLNFEIRGNGILWNETKHVELEQFLHAFTSRGFDSVSWAFLLWYPVVCNLPSLQEGRMSQRPPDRALTCFIVKEANIAYAVLLHESIAISSAIIVNGLRPFVHVTSHQLLQASLIFGVSRCDCMYGMRTIFWSTLTVRWSHYMTKIDVFLQPKFTKVRTECVIDSRRRKQ